MARAKEWREGSSTHFLENGDPLKTFTFKETGLAYYINPKPAPHEKTLDENDYYNWYRPFHVPSQTALGMTFFSEVRVRTFVRALAPYTDWSRSEEALQGQEDWQDLEKRVYTLFHDRSEK